MSMAFSDDCQVGYHPKLTPAEIVWVTVVAARYFDDNLERALMTLGEACYIPEERLLSVWRFNTVVGDVHFASKVLQAMGFSASTT